MSEIPQDEKLSGNDAIRAIRDATLEWVARFFRTQDYDGKPMPSGEVADLIVSMRSMPWLPAAFMDPVPRIFRKEDCVPHTASGTPRAAQPQAPDPGSPLHGLLVGGSINAAEPFVPQAPAPSSDARGQWLTPECQHTIPELLRLAARHINPLAAAFVRDMHAAADRLDAAPSAPSDALRKVLEMIRADMTPANIQYESHYLRQFIVAWATKIDAALTASPSESREQELRDENTRHVEELRGVVAFLDEFEACPECGAPGGEAGDIQSGHAEDGCCQEGRALRRRLVAHLGPGSDKQVIRRLTGHCGQFSNSCSSNTATCACDCDGCMAAKRPSAPTAPKEPQR